MRCSRPEMKASVPGRVVDGRVSYYKVCIVILYWILIRRVLYHSLRKLAFLVGLYFQAFVPLGWFWFSLMHKKMVWVNEESPSLVMI
ncbi:hypothetical protein E2C01_091493 [Portunus trituberculatus]|uniref:Uncharacterized protein n=1 Tax=Portunus trituberculatus TaxID=210409 RepID=A0A5B7JPI5_PORTR|nr:hypothetical protein [Portunus trituberculatus]